MHTNQATYITQVADIFLVASVSRLSGCVFSMCGDFPLLFVEGLCTTNLAHTQKKSRSSQKKTEVSRRQSLPVSV